MSAYSRAELPLVSVVTPTYNMARFLPAAIESVLAQDYPQIEYLVLDAGSTDGTLELLTRYGSRVRWRSQPDRGQGDAINQGFAMSRGNVFAFLNADDVYLPRAVSTAVQHLVAHPEAGVVYGEGEFIDEQGVSLGRYPTRDASDMSLGCPICQPAAFIRREAFSDLDLNLHFALDYDLWLRIAERWRLLRIPELLAQSRMHRANKTLGSRGRALRETVEVVHRRRGYVPFGPVFGYACHKIDGKDQFFEPSEPTAGKFAAAVLLGFRYNYSHPIRWMAECAREVSRYRQRVT